MAAESPIIAAFGWGATACSFITSTSALTESRTIHVNKKTGPLDPNPFLAQWVNQVTWGMYGIVTRTVPMYFNYSYGISCAFVFFFVFGRACTVEQFPSYRNRLGVAAVIAAASIIVGLVQPPEVLGWYGTVTCMLIWILPFRRIYLSKSTACISVLLNLAGLLSNLCWAVYGLARNDLPLGWSSVGCVILTIVLLGLWVYEFKIHGSLFGAPSVKEGGEMKEKLEGNAAVEAPPSTSVPISPPPAQASPTSHTPAASPTTLLPPQPATQNAAVA